MLRASKHGKENYTAACRRTWLASLRASGCFSSASSCASLVFQTLTKSPTRSRVAFDVVGAMSSSGAFAPQPRTEASSIETLWRGAKAMQRTVIDSMRPSGDDELDAAVTKTTEDEVANGWLTGPWTEKQLSDKLGLWVPVPRSGVKQGDSVRAVDDYTFAGQNGATSIAEKIDTGGVDVVVGIARCLLLAEPGGDINIQLSTGEVASATIHPDWTKDCWSDFVCNKFLPRGKGSLACGSRFGAHHVDTLG